MATYLSAEPGPPARFPHSASWCVRWISLARRHRRLRLRARQGKKIAFRQLGKKTASVYQYLLVASMIRAGAMARSRRRKNSTGQTGRASIPLWSRKFNSFRVLIQGGARAGLVLSSLPSPRSRLGSTSGPAHPVPSWTEQDHPAPLYSRLHLSAPASTMRFAGTVRRFLLGRAERTGSISMEL
jgi:hypothetical protein